jgi:hypothetical protein
MVREEYSVIKFAGTVEGQSEQMKVHRCVSVAELVDKMKVNVEESHIREEIRKKRGKEEEKEGGGCPEK